MWGLLAGAPFLPPASQLFWPVWEQDSGASMNLGPGAGLSALIPVPVGSVEPKPPCQCIPFVGPPLTQTRDLDPTWYGKP